MASGLSNFLAIWAVIALPALVVWNVIAERRNREQTAKLLVWPFIIGFGCIQLGGSLLEQGGWVGFIGLVLLGLAGFITYTLVRAAFEG